jgi:hypothetical protein
LRSALSFEIEDINFGIDLFKIVETFFYIDLLNITTTLIFSDKYFFFKWKYKKIDDKE